MFQEFLSTLRASKVPKGSKIIIIIKRIIIIQRKTIGLCALSGLGP